MQALIAQGRLLIDGKPHGPADIDAVFFADTGAEWPHTRALLPRVASEWAALGIPFYHLAKPPEHTWRGHERPKGSRETPPWHAQAGATVAERAAQGYYHRRLPIRDEYIRYGVIAVTSSASCTDNHKVQPMRRALSDLSVERGGLDNRAHGAAVRRGEAQPHRILIGFTADEAHRAADPLHVRRPSFERLAFPLLEAGISKLDEDTILWASGWDTPSEPVYKSGCYLCPFQPAGWFWVLREQHPDLFALVVEYERVALERHPGMWVLGTSKRPLPEAVAAWRERNPTAMPEDLLRKEYARGCAANPRQVQLLEPAGQPPGFYLVSRLRRALARADVSSIAAIGARLRAAGFASYAEQAELLVATYQPPAQTPEPPSGATQADLWASHATKPSPQA